MKKNLKSKQNNNNKIAIIFPFVIILIVGFLFYNFILKHVEAVGGNVVCGRGKSRAHNSSHRYNFYNDCDWRCYVS